MNDKQIVLLEKNNYEVLKEVDFVRDKTTDRPAVYITYNRYSKRFELNCIGFCIGSYDSDIHGFQNYVTEKALLVMELNQLCGD